MQYHPIKNIFWAFIIWLYSYTGYGQKTGLVLSGGGSDALAHIGVLKALEEKGIFPDYIVGSSVGALIGAYYACGYSPEEIENIVRSAHFINAAAGKVNFQYGYLFKQRQDFASWLTIRLDPSKSIIRNLPVNVINSIPIEYYLTETFSPYSIHAKNNFDSLFIPFRCVASDVIHKKPVIYRNAILPVAIRSSMSYPFYLRPFLWDSLLLYDGGLYNNFPIQVMYKEFHPDIIIGSDVSEKLSPPDEEDLYGQIRRLVTNNNDTFSLANTIIIRSQPRTGLLGFEQWKSAIDSGYKATLRVINQHPELFRTDSLKMKIFTEKRKKWKKEVESLQIQDIVIKGNSKKANEYIKRSLHLSNSYPFSPDIQTFRIRYFRLASDDRLKNIFPVIEEDTQSHKKVLVIHAKKEKPFFIDVGAMVSNRPISFIFAGLEYHHLGKTGLTLYANGYLGKLMSGGMGKLRLDFPGRFPFYTEPQISYSRWDYFNSSTLFLDLKIPPFLIYEDINISNQVVFPVGNLSLFKISGGKAQWNYFYFQVPNFNKLDTTDKTIFSHYYGQTELEMNTLNRKMYPNEGLRLRIGGKYLEGNENYYPGNISPVKDTILNKFHHWAQFYSSADIYIKPWKFLRLGLYGEVIYGSQNFFSNYYSSLLAAPSFEPIPEMKTFFYEKYRTHSYFALGTKLVTIPIKNIEFRGELYYFQPFLTIIRDNDNPYLPKYSVPLLNQYLIASAVILYQTPVGPLSLSVNYLDRIEPVTVFFHFGYVLFNKKSSEF